MINTRSEHLGVLNTEEQHHAGNQTLAISGAPPALQRLVLSFPGSKVLTGLDHCRLGHGQCGVVFWRCNALKERTLKRSPDTVMGARWLKAHKRSSPETPQLGHGTRIFPSDMIRISFEGFRKLGVPQSENPIQNGCFKECPPFGNHRNSSEFCFGERQIYCFLTAM